VALDNECEVKDGVRDGDLRAREGGRSTPSGDSNEGVRPHFSMKSRREILTACQTLSYSMKKGDVQKKDTPGPFHRSSSCSKNGSHILNLACLVTFYELTATDDQLFQLSTHKFISVHCCTGY